MPYTLTIEEQIEEQIGLKSADPDQTASQGAV